MARLGNLDFYFSISCDIFHREGPLETEWSEPLVVQMKILKIREGKRLKMHSKLMTKLKLADWSLAFSTGHHVRQPRA